MRLNNMKIGTQLRVGLGVIFALVIALGAQAWRQTYLLWQQTETMYEHPLQVRRALGMMEVDIERISRNLRELFLVHDGAEAEALVQRIELDKSDIDRQFAILEDRFLGSRGDILTLQSNILRWNALRAETIRLLRDGKLAAAEARIRPGGAQDAQAASVSSNLAKIDDFARNKGDQLYRDAAVLSESLKKQLVAFILTILLLALLVSWRLLTAIRGPLSQLTAASEQFRQGQMDARSGYTAANEFGALAASFDAMADAVQTQMQINERAAQLAGVMLREEEVHAFCRELLKSLLEHTGSQVGAVYFLNEAKSALEHFESIGLGTGAHAAFSATAQEGELGAALATRRIQRITEIPADTRFAFAAVSGVFMPREILTIPVLANHDVVAAISLASIRAYDAQALRLIDDSWAVLTARMNGVLAFRRIEELAAGLELRNRELDEQRRELAAQADELSGQNLELEMQKEQLDEANRLKSSFLSTMSHELRTPLNSVIALSGVLGRRLDGKIPGEELGYLEVIERNGRQLLALINDILDLSRVEAGREEITAARCSLPALAADILEMIGPQAREQGIELVNLMDPDLPSIVSDPDKCRHILQNLVANAVKFTVSGSVQVASRQSADEVFVMVSDTGIGIAADQLPHIFEEFRQADDSASRKFGGTGLGLAIAAKYAALLHGGISVESAPGAGSTFTLRLPLALGGATPADAGPASAPSGQGKIVLLVEDSEPAVIQMTDILVGQGYRVQVARNGHEALTQIRRTLPEAMILDLMMPEVDGFEVLRALRSEERTFLLPVLILTAKHVTREELSFLKGNHIHQLIQKGDVSRAQLLAAVAKMVAPADAAEPEGQSGRPLVLVVEDNPDNRRTARALLSERYRVVEAQDGQAGVEQARRVRPDIILMDIAMPVLDGIAALREIRSDAALRRTPVIAVTASAMKGDRETILSHGFDGYLSKPIDAELLHKTLRDALD